MPMVFVNGSLHPPARKFAGYIVLVAGIVAVVLGSWFAVLLVVMGAYLSLTRFGTELEPDKDRYREFNSFAGIRFGTWHHLHRYPYLCILKTDLTSSAYSLSNRNAVTGSESYMEVYLLSESHHHRILLKRCESIKEAEESGIELSQKLNKPLVDFNPVRTSRR